MNLNQYYTEFRENLWISKIIKRERIIRSNWRIKVLDRKAQDVASNNGWVLQEPPWSQVERRWYHSELRENLLICKIIKRERIIRSHWSIKVYEFKSILHRI